MLDENLPTFFFKASKDSVKQDTTIYLAQYGNDAQPTYTLRRPDPASPNSKNRYAAAISDCWNNEILYGEMLIIPEWTQPTLSAEEARKHATLAATPLPVLPTQCTLSLYNPDQQVTLHHTPSKWNTGESWEFELPQQVFRQPSASDLDRTQGDPGLLGTTPTIPFKWKRDSKLGKDLTMFLDGKARSLGSDGKKKAQKEPDIPLAFFRNFRELTIYEPNMSRVDIEDPKGFEVTVLLAATVIRDVYHGSLYHTFNVADGPGHPIRRSSAETPGPNKLQPRPTASQQPLAGASLSPSATQHPPFPTRPHAASQPPPLQGNLDAETARLKAQVEAEERDAARRQKEAAKQARKAEKESEKLARQVAEQEEAAARKRRADIDRETERLRKEFEEEQKRAAKGKGRRSDARPPPLPPRHSTGQVPGPGYAGMSGALAPRPPASAGFVGQRPGSSNGFSSPQPGQQQPPHQGRTGGGGFLGFGRHKEGSQGKLVSKKSALF